MLTERHALFLSIHPRFAELILNGAKTVELRRTRPAVPPGFSILLYASSPARQLVGSCTVTSVDVGKPSRIWMSYREQLLISRSEFDCYYRDAVRAVAISLGGPKRLVEPRSLDEIRQRLPRFWIPQSFRYLAENDIESLNLVDLLSG